MKIKQKTKRNFIIVVLIILLVTLCFATCWLTKTVIDINKNYNMELLKTYTDKI